MKYKGYDIRFDDRVKEKFWGIPEEQRAIVTHSINKPAVKGALEGKESESAREALSKLNLLIMLDL